MQLYKIRRKVQGKRHRPIDNNLYTLEEARDYLRNESTFYPSGEFFRDLLKTTYVNKENKTVILTAILEK